jgi:hypothetical protein
MEKNKKKRCEEVSPIKIIDEISEFAQENPGFIKQIGWAIIILCASGGFAAATWGIYFLID